MGRTVAHDPLAGRGPFSVGDAVVAAGALAVMALGVRLAYSFRPRQET